MKSLTFEYLIASKSKKTSVFEERPESNDEREGSSPRLLEKCVDPGRLP